MVTRSRMTGIDVVGARPWGTHVSQLYETKKDLLDTLISYFNAGLAGNEQCVWVVGDPLTQTEARAALGEAVEIVPAREWYFEGDTFAPTSAI